MSEVGPDGKLFFSSSDRNKEPILEVLKKHLGAASKGILIEVGSGSGQHAAHFAPAFPSLVWQPTEYDETRFASIEAYTEEMANTLPPVKLDAADEASWAGLMAGLGSGAEVGAVFLANITHISPIEVTRGIFKGAGQLLVEGGFLMIYGPFTVEGRFTTDSNLEFHRSLLKRDPSWGYRDIGHLEEMAAANGMCLAETLQMPANNFMLVFQKPVKKDSIFA